jgi:hypothetical protein
MTIPSPFASGFPLNPTPFKSRVQDFIDTNKNYYAVAFKPGFPLQASELNEMQEIFYTQQTLSNALNTSGWTGAVPWSGATPLEKGAISFALTGSITFGVGWYYIQQSSFNGGIGVWAYNPTIRTVATIHTENSVNAYNTKYGFAVKSTTVQCANSSTPGTNEDLSLQDQSNFNVIGGPCGAARLKLELVRAGTTAGTDEIFVPIFGGPQSTVNGSTVIARTIRYENGDIKSAGA